MRAVVVVRGRRSSSLLRRIRSDNFPPEDVHQVGEPQIGDKNSGKFRNALVLQKKVENNEMLNCSVVVGIKDRPVIYT